MKNLVVTTVILAGMLFSQTAAHAQFKSKKAAEETPKTETDLLLEKMEASETPVVITLEQALEIALSENVSVKVAAMQRRAPTLPSSRRSTLWDLIRGQSRSRLCTCQWVKDRNL